MTEAPKLKVDPNINYYEVLRLTPTNKDELFDPSQITREQIKKSYRQLAKVYHPDREGGNQQLFEQVNTAYEILCNDELRKQIDSVWAQKRKRLEHEKTLAENTRKLRRLLEEREKRSREENRDNLVPNAKRKKKSSKVSSEELDRVRTTGYDALRKIQEEYKKKQEELQKQKEKLVQQSDRKHAGSY
jgi:curved DNA-binding protein CbpA